MDIAFQYSYNEDRDIFKTPPHTYTLQGFLYYGDSIEKAGKQNIATGIYATCPVITSHSELLDYLKHTLVIIRKPLILKDSNHIFHLLNAHISTCIYIDDIIKECNGITHHEDIKRLITKNEIQQLNTMWNLAINNNNIPIINCFELSNILTRYVYEYIKPLSVIKNTETGDNLYELPINYILKYLGFDGIVGDIDTEKSFKTRFVSFNYKKSFIADFIDYSNSNAVLVY